jgi:hypothetical protein
MNKREELEIEIADGVDGNQGYDSRFYTDLTISQIKGLDKAITEIKKFLITENVDAKIIEKYELEFEQPK